MVYDVPRNFIGDTHWKEDEIIQDGDEVTLEKDGVLVQVAERIGTTETDLTELRRSKNKSSEHGSSPAKVPQTPGLRGVTTQKQGTQLKHRSLNALLGTPKGPLGKAAFSTRSPYEDRTADAENEQWGSGRPPKRQRLDRPPGCNVTRTAEATAVEQKEDPLWARTADAKWKQKQKRETTAASGQQKLNTQEVIELSDDEDDRAEHEETFLPGLSSDVLAPPSSPAKKPTPALVQGPKKVSHSRTMAAEGQRADQRQISSAPASKARRGAAIEKADRPTHGPDAVNTHRSETRPAKQSVDSGADAEQPAKTLRMAPRSSKKRTLLCQDQMGKKSSRVHSANTEKAIGSILSAVSKDESLTRPEAKSQRKLLEGRLANIRRRSAAELEEMPGCSKSAEVAEASASNKPQHADSTNCRPDLELGDGAMGLAELEQMIMPPSNPSVPAMAKTATGPLAKKDRSLRKVVSEVTHSSAQRRPREASMRFTPSASKRAQTVTAPSANEPEKSAKPATALPSKPDGEKAMLRSVSLDTTTNGTSTVIFSKPFQTPKAPGPKTAVAQIVPNPWSREAFDLFEWRPPRWDEENWGYDDGVPAT